MLTLAEKESYSLDAPLAVLMELDDIPPESIHDSLRCEKSACGQRLPWFARSERGSAGACQEIERHHSPASKSMGGCYAYEQGYRSPALGPLRVVGNKMILTVVCFAHRLHSSERN